MKIVGIAAALLATTSLSAFAAPSADDAAKLQANLQSYFGTAPETLQVSPDGDGFKAVLDLSKAFTAAQANGAEVSINPFEFHLTPDGTGKWKVHQEGELKLAMKVKDQLDLTETAEKVSIDGTFDEALSTFTSFDFAASNLTFAETMNDPAGTSIKADGKFDGITAKGTATANANGGADVKFTETFASGNVHEVIAAKDGQPLDLQIKFAGGELNGTMTAARTAAMPALLKFIVAHQTKEAVVKDQQTLKDAITALLPVFDNSAGEGAFNKIEVQTPMGPTSLEKLSVSFNFNGAVKEGHFEEGFSIEGLTLPPGLVPAWGAGLVPKLSSLNVAVTGFDVETPLKAWLAAADFGKDPPVDEAASAAMMQSFMPKGTVDVTINKTAVSNDTYAFTAEGTFAAGPQAMPSGKAHITAKGFDELMKIVQSSPPEAGLQGMAGMIIAAKGLGKTGGDGTFSYDVDATPDGKILVNGTDVNKIGQQ